MSALPPLTIRTALASEQKLLEALQWRASLNNPGDRAALLAHADAIELPLAQLDAGAVFVAEAEGRILGFGGILPRADGDSELDALFVEPDTWRRGVGRALVERCVSAARAAGAHTLHVVGNPHARGFYESCGFRHVGTTQMRFGVGLLMTKAIL